MKADFWKSLISRIQHIPGLLINCQSMKELVPSKVSKPKKPKPKKKISVEANYGAKAKKRGECDRSILTVLNHSRVSPFSTANNFRSS